jgi:hypothetical protein
MRVKFRGVYNQQVDPQETHNLWKSVNVAAVKTDLAFKLIELLKAMWALFRVFLSQFRCIFGGMVINHTYNYNIKQ